MFPLPILVTPGQFLGLTLSMDHVPLPGKEPLTSYRASQEPFLGHFLVSSGSLGTSVLSVD